MRLPFGYVLNERVHGRKKRKQRRLRTAVQSDERTVDVHISRVRDRFRDNPDFEIITVRGLGYKAVYLR